MPAFDVILIETVGIGQEAMPFAPGLVDRSVLVMSPDYGAALQLQKIAMLDLADIVVINKSDLAQSRTACSEIAKRHRDGGVDELFDLLRSPAPAAGAQLMVAHG